MKNMLIKVCGMQEGENIREVEQLGVNMIGLIFYSKSPRAICELPDYLPLQAKRVGVFVNENKKYIQIICDRFSLDYIQLHGNESPEYCRTLRKAGYKIIKNFPIATAEDLKKTEQYKGVCDYFLFDTKCETHGGSGKTFEWSILHHYHGETPFLLSGGLDLSHVGALRLFEHPQLSGYDINSRFETKPGKKNINKISEFIKQIKEYEQN